MTVKGTKYFNLFHILPTNNAAKYVIFVFVDLNSCFLFVAIKRAVLLPS